MFYEIGINNHLSRKNTLIYRNLIEMVSSMLNKKTIIIPLPLHFFVFSARAYYKLFSKAIIFKEQVLFMQEDKAFTYEYVRRDLEYIATHFEEEMQEEVKHLGIIGISK